MKVTLGTDPELVFIGEEGVIPARNYFSPQGEHMPGERPEIGADGHQGRSGPAELRPPPHETPEGVVKSMKAILERHYKTVPEEVCWRAGSFVEGRPLGGHIHFGGIKAEQDLLDTMDGVMAQLSVILEDADGARKRRASKYGRLGDVRTKNWGFEYRTLASWVLSPSISLGIFALCKAIVYEHESKGPLSIHNLKGDLLRTVTRIDKKKFQNADKIYFMKKLRNLWSIISKYSYWNTEEGRVYWSNVALLKHTALHYPDWHNEKDMLHRWKIRDYTPSTYKFERKDHPVIIPVGVELEADEAWDLMMRRRND